jgi:dolichol-phosphate mannosyltransferase
MRLQRFGRFAGVGMVGFALQLAIVFALTAAGVNYLIATGLAVELAILHNFVRHELHSWRGTRATSTAAVAGRLLLFNGSTAVVSIAGNVILTALLVGFLHVAPVVATALAVTALSIVNYTVARRWIFASRSSKGAWADHRPQTADHRPQELRAPLSLESVV